MKKLLALVLSLLLAVSLLPAQAEEPTPMVDGWFMPDTIEVTDDARAALEEAMAEFTDITLTPVALLGTQVVAGVNYCLLCVEVTEGWEEAPSYAYAYVFKPLEGPAEMLSIQPLTLSVYGDDMGGFSIFYDAVLIESVGTMDTEEGNEGKLIYCVDGFTGVLEDDMTGLYIVDGFNAENWERLVLADNFEAQIPDGDLFRFVQGEEFAQWWDEEGRLSGDLYFTVMLNENDEVEYMTVSTAYYANGYDSEESDTAVQDADYIVSCPVKGSAAGGFLTMIQSTRGPIELEICLFDTKGAMNRWTMTIDAQEAEGANGVDSVLRYTDCTCVETSGDGVAVRYENGTGAIGLTENDTYYWIDDQENAGSGLEFELTGDLLVTSYFVDAEGGRAEMNITAPFSFEASDWQVEIAWADSAFETTVWSFTLPAVESFNVYGDLPSFTYENAACFYITTDENGEETIEQVYDNGTGTLTPVLLENGLLGYVWQSASDDGAAECFFEPLTVDNTAE